MPFEGEVFRHKEEVNPLRQTWQVILAGAGGQGLVLGGVLLGEAASLFAGRNALQTQSYGIASRGGFSRSEVVISEGEIVYPGVIEPDVVMALTSEALEMYEREAREGTLIVTDDAISASGSRAKGFPLVKTARGLGNPGVQNLVGLGVILALTDMIPPEAMVQAIEARFAGKPSSINLNLSAFRAGLTIAGRRKGFD